MGIKIGTTTSTRGRLTLNSVLMHKDGAFNVTDCGGLWLPPAQKGKDTDIGHAVGVLSNKRRPNGTQVGLPIIIGGFKKYDGSGSTWRQQVDQQKQFEENLYYLRTNVLDPRTSGDGTITASLVLPSGATKTGTVTVLPFTVLRWFGIGCSGTLDLLVPNGTLA